MSRLLKTAALLIAGAFAAARLRRSARRPAPQPPGAEAHGAGAGRFQWKRRLRTIAAFLVMLAVGGFLVAASGIVPIKASAGHWAITRWFLNWSMARSVSTHSMGVNALPLDSLDHPSLVLKGAGHYDTGCRPCHGSPILPHPRVAQQMTPRPPYLPPLIPEWEPDELFYIVKHGVKFTGMPAWPTQQRDDEVWAMVAFLRTLPDLDAEAYRQLARGEGSTTGEGAPIQSLQGPEEVPSAVTNSCARCHGVDGLGRGTGAFPKLAGQHPTYLYAALGAYARGERHSGVMEPIAAGLSLDEMRALARYYGSREGSSPPPSREVLPALKRGEAIALRGIPDEGVPSCVDCHGPGDLPRNPFYPELAGQYADYLVLQLELFKEEHRGGSAYAHLMHPTADRLTPEQMRDVALYYESLALDRNRPAQ